MDICPGAALWVVEACVSFYNSRKLHSGLGVEPRALQQYCLAQLPDALAITPALLTKGCFASEQYLYRDTPTYHTQPLAHFAVYNNFLDHL